MFDFLDDVFDTFSPMVEFGAGLYDMFRGHDSRSADAMYNLLGAAVDPNSPQFKNLAAVFEERYRTDAIKGIQEQMRQHQRDVARGGRGTIVNPERRDEARSAAAAQAFMDAARSGQDMAFKTLTGVAPQYQYGIPYDQYMDELKSEQIAELGGGLADLFDLWGGGTHKFDFADLSKMTPAQARDADYFDFERG